MKVDESVCLNCGRQLASRHLYCPSCGGNQDAIGSYLLTVLEAPTGKPEPAKSTNASASGGVQKQENATQHEKAGGFSAEKPKSSKKIAVFASLGLVAILATLGVIGSSSPSPDAQSPTKTSSVTASPTPTPTKVFVYYDADSPAPETRELALASCSALSEAVSALDFLPRSAEQISAEVDSISSSSKAKTYVSDNASWIKVPLADSFRSYLYEIAEPKVTQLITALGYDDEKYDLDFDEWRAGFTDTAFQVCELEDSVRPVWANIAEFQISVDKLLTLAK